MPQTETALAEDEARPPGRRLAVDLARGAAVVAMVIYHFAWDLSQLGFVATDIQGHLGWSLFARLVAASFLILSGVSLVLAHGRALRPAAFLRRLAVLAAAAAAVSGATYLVFPDSFIFFGILHNLVLSSLIALPFLRAPTAVTGLAAVALLATPLLVSTSVFDSPALAPLGLGRTVPVTNDYVPVFPWTGFVLAGMAGWRLAGARAGRAGPARPGAAARLLAGLGRRSLLVYLLHQPVLFGALFGLRQVLGPDLAAEARPFMRHCVASCEAAGTPGPTCRAACTCTVEELRQDGLWRKVLAGRPTAEEFSQAELTAQLCLRRATSPGQ
ncbi:heparan-alpha-glucosaminide N-acetyltransferase [Enterovirga sp.]|uniref:heparan-alpha-glucosaminide N-acetyltransferase n=1 Tax=Enterovirga sp. TaxID=2026350 RepID=UPI0026221494|nr:heparan-alpha-glucosaminide N-acetyltransferase [Enterovirga sp.]MDB5592143.1 hypothetical protein [Enterovirga sp.]